ncbi:MAG: ASKHA domain-containing protein, partial [candidate division WOR-3 bacterium]|nr:ASKHA domain-containing protein [candidate division WOR-3 bacterium]
IHNQRPIGFCASGLIDLLAIILKKHWLLPNGYLMKSINLNGLRITQQDIRKLQLAIAAIRAGITILLRKAHLKAADISEIILTGEFGDKLNKSNLIRLGLIPQTVKKIRFENGLPLKGAVSLLLDKSKIKQAEKIRKASKHIELALEKDFQQIFIQSMTLSPWH